MAYLLTSATDIADLLDQLYDFAVADGWTGTYNDSAGAGGNGAQIAIHADNCFVAIGEQSSSVNPIARTDSLHGGTVNDATIYMALGTSLTGGLNHFWGHPGSIVTTATDADRVSVNQLYGTLNNVWFFSGGGSDPKYIYVVFQSAPTRYGHFGFGNFDRVGMTTPNCGYCWGLFYTFWPTSALITSGGYVSNAMDDSSHYYGMTFGGANGNSGKYNIYVPSGVLPGGYTAGIYSQETIPLTPNISANQLASTHYSGTTIGKLLDFFNQINNKNTTGGVPLLSISGFFRETIGGASHCFLGVQSGIRVCNIDDYNPAQEINYSTDTWVLFPWVQKGIYANTRSGASPTEYPNTVWYGLAYKKNV